MKNTFNPNRVFKVYVIFFLAFLSFMSVVIASQLANQSDNINAMSKKFDALYLQETKTVSFPGCKLPYNLKNADGSPFTSGQITQLMFPKDGHCLAN